MIKNRKIPPFGIMMALAGCLTIVNSAPAIGKDVRSSTFVGNGGDAQDLDLGVTLAVIKTIGNRVAKNAPQSLCTCSDEWQENDICRVLRQLSADEVKSCRMILQKYGDDLAALADSSSPVQFDWAYGGLSVQSQAQAQSQKSRPVDAVTQTAKQRIIINRSRFQDMPPSYRVALVTHELFHLINFDKGFVTDEQPAVPFASGRAMLNALGAAIAMEANEQDVFHDFHELKDVSRSGKNHRLHLETRAISNPERTSAQLLKESNSTGVGFGYTYEMGRFGLGLAMETVNYDGIASGVSIAEVQTIYHVNAQYRFFPLNRQLSRWNEMYIGLGVDAGIGSSEYKASTRHVEKSDKSPLTSAGALVRFNIPLVNNLWIVTGGEYRQVRYEYKTLRIKTIENQSVFTLGGAYGF